MNWQTQIEAKTPARPPVPHAPPGLLQRKCACGNPTAMSSSCDECQKNRLQRSAARSARRVRFRNSPEFCAPPASARCGDACVMEPRPATIHRRFVTLSAPKFELATARRVTGMTGAGCQCPGITVHDTRAGRRIWRRPRSHVHAPPSRACGWRAGVHGRESCRVGPEVTRSKRAGEIMLAHERTPVQHKPGDSPSAVNPTRREGQGQKSRRQNRGRIKTGCRWCSAIKQAEALATRDCGRSRGVPVDSRIRAMTRFRQDRQ